MLRVFSTQWSGRLHIGRWLIRFITIASVLALLPVAYIGIYNHPCPLDDYANAQWHSFGAMQRDLYLHWSGRYFNNVAVALCPLHWRSIAGYRVAVICIMAGFALAYELLLGRAIGSLTNAPKNVALALGVASAALLFNNLPSLSEGFFWYSSEVTYMLPATAMLCLLMLLMKADAHASTSRPMLWLSALLAAIAVGGNETTLVLCDAVIAGGWLFYRRRGLAAQTRFYQRLLVIAVACSAVAVFAPGNFMRHDTNPGNLPMLLPTWLYHSQKAFFHWLADPFFLAYSSLALLLLAPFTFRVMRLNLLSAFLLPLAVILLLTLPAHYALGTAPPPRVMNIAYAFFLMAWLHFLLHISNSLRVLFGENEASGRIARQAGIVAVIILLLVSFNTNDFRSANLFVVAKSLVRGIPQAYNAELNARYRRMGASPNDTLALAPIRHQHENVLYYTDIAARRTSGTSQLYSRYWGVKAVYLDTASR